MRDVPAFFAELGAWAAGRGVPATRHAYGPADDQHADLRLPETAGPHRVAVVIHGGFWRAAYTKQNTAAVAVALTELGWATWNIEYRRGDGYSATLDDVRAACDALRGLDAPLDLGSVVAVGHSAGGQLALWAGAEGLVSAAAALAGVCDLDGAARDDLGDGAVVAFLGGDSEAVAHAYARADPLRRLPVRAPVLLVHGTTDDRVPITQSRAYRDAAAAAGDACRLVELEGADHFDVIDPRSDAWPAVAGGLAALLS
jgi:acetyl esterase/lipase